MLLHLGPFITFRPSTASSSFLVSVKIDSGVPLMF